ncbi:MAG: alpha/beta hydrolase [Candidatus Pacebacteria bacterium]|nr:alpha/beta hydrolase [Candidatus Paceibacterota bacterium]
MKNALILHGTDFGKKQQQRFNNWFPWLKKKLEQLDYQVFLPELPQAWEPNLARYWLFLKNFDFNRESILIGHSSGATAVFGLLHELPPGKEVGLAVSVAGFYKDEGWGCRGLFAKEYNWEKIRSQVKKIVLIWSPDDPYISREQTDFLSQRLRVRPTIIPDKKHFNLEASPGFIKFPELLKIIKDNQ